MDQLTRGQAIIWTNYGASLILPLGTNLSKIPIKLFKINFLKIETKDIACKMAAILSRPQYVKYYFLLWPLVPWC